MELTTIDFPAENIKLNRIFSNRRTISSYKRRAKEKIVPKKVQTVYGDLFFPSSPKDRPYIYGSLVLTLDGKLGFQNQNRSNSISKGNFLDQDGGLADLWMVNLLRTYCDGIVFGSETLKVEKNITGHIYDVELSKDRIEVLGKSFTIPWNIVITRSGDSVPLDHIIFQKNEIPSLIITSSKGAKKIAQVINNPYILLDYMEKEHLHEYIDEKLKKKTNELVLLVGGKEEEIDTKYALMVLKLMGIEKLDVESPSYMYHLMKEQLLDEAFINYSCIYAGGELTLGNYDPFRSDDYPAVDILSIHIHASNFIYTRQKFKYLRKQLK